MKIMELTVKEYEKIMKEQIDEEDKDIPLIPDSELYSFDNPRFYFEGKLTKDEKLDYNFKVLQEKINQIIEVINNDSTRD